MQQPLVDGKGDSGGDEGDEDEAQRRIRVPLLESSSEAYGAVEVVGGATDPSRSDPVAVLPFEVTMLIFEQLDTADLLSVACVSRLWQKASEDHRLWRQKCLRELTPAMPAAEIVVENRDYKLVCPVLPPSPSFVTFIAVIAYYSHSYVTAVQD